MGILNWFRGAPEKTKNLPAPTPVVSQPSQHIPSDLPPIKVPRPKPVPKVPVMVHEEITTYDEAPAQRPTVQAMAPKPVVRAVKSEMREQQKPAAPEDLKHIFISSEEYATIMDHTNKIRSKLLETEERLQSLAQLRGTEEKELLKWQEHLAILEKKLTYMETILEKAGEV